MGSNIISKGIRFITNSDYRFLVNASRGVYNSMPDEEYLKRIFRIKVGYDLNLDNPQTFNEKIQWLKLHDRKPIYTQMVDKIEAKKIVSGLIGEQYIIPTIGVWDNFDCIDFDLLPEQFVLKCSHDSGGLVICKDKNHFDYKAAKKIINTSLGTNYYWSGREWPYKNVNPRILAEKYMEEGTKRKGLVDYKFFCFDGTPKLLYISRGLEHHPTAEISFYGMDGIEKEYHRSDFKPYHNAIVPNNFEEMKVVAEKLAKKVGCPFVRIDLYSINDRTYFSEITFSPCSGMVPFEPMSADSELGKEIVLPTEGQSK